MEGGRGKERRKKRSAGVGASEEIVPLHSAACVFPLLFCFVFLFLCLLSGLEAEGMY